MVSYQLLAMHTLVSMVTFSMASITITMAPKNGNKAGVTSMVLWQGPAPTIRKHGRTNNQTNVDC